MVANNSKRRGFRPLYLLLLIPYVAMMWVPFYNRIEPSLAGIPFFYWYQMLLDRARRRGDAADLFQRRARRESQWTASPVTVFVALFGFVTILGFFAGRWRARRSHPVAANGALGGRRFGTVVTWFLLGGDLYTAYTFIAVPALLFGAGATGFFAMPYTIIVYPLLFMSFRARGRCRTSKGYVTAAISCADVSATSTLALAIAITGIVATMPYIALQLVGMEVVIAGLGLAICSVNAAALGICIELPLLDRLHRLWPPTPTQAALRAPGDDRGGQGFSDLCDGDLAVIIVIPAELGGYANIFRQRRSQKADPVRHPFAPISGRNLPMPRLALGSALALFLYPHSVTGILSSSSRDVIKRNAVAMPAYSFALALIALLGFMAIAAGVKAMPEYAAGFKAFGNQLRRAGAVPAHVPLLGWLASPLRPSASAHWCPPRSCPSRAAILFTRNIYKEYHQSELHQRAGKRKWPRSPRWSSSWGLDLHPRICRDLCDRVAASWVASGSARQCRPCCWLYTRCIPGRC